MNCYEKGQKTMRKDAGERQEGERQQGEGYRGCVHIYCGDGKGKTSAAIGLAVRAAGRGRRIVIARFLKNDDSGEVLVLKGIPGIHLYPCEKSFGFFYQMTDEQRKEAGQYYGALFRRAWEEAVGRQADLLILDELMAACRYGLVSEDEVIRRLESRPDGLEVVMTGRDPSPELLELADYVSEIRKEKHPYDRGVAAREGIEY